MREKAYFLSKFKIFCERIDPANKKIKGTILMITGGAHTGACYKVTPDGRAGWAYNFVDAGYSVYIVDWPSVGRSGYIDPKKITGKFVVESFSALLHNIGKEVIVLTHSMSGPYGWKLMEIAPRYIKHIISIAPGPMGNIQSSPNILFKTDNFVEAILGLIKYKIDLNKEFVCSSEYAKKKFIGTSKMFPELNFDNYFASIVPIPSSLIYERLNIDSSQLKISESLIKKSKIKVSILTGTNDADHPLELDFKIHEFFLKLGIDSQFFGLGDFGINGNGHMLMQEKNSELIAKFIIDKVI